MNYNYNTVKKLIITVGVLLFIQYWLGMVVNLFGEIPKIDPAIF